MTRGWNKRKRRDRPQGQDFAAPLFLNAACDTFASAPKNIDLRIQGGRGGEVETLNAVSTLDDNTSGVPFVLK